MKKKIKILIILMAVSLSVGGVLAGIKPSFLSEMIISVKAASEKAAASEKKSDTDVPANPATKITGVPLQPKIPKPEIPQNILWLMVFKMNAALAKESKKMIENGEDGRLFAEYFQRRAKLTAEEAAILTENSNAFLTEIAPVDGQAQQIIENFWANFDQTKPGAKSAAPAPPPELQTLQSRKDEITLRYRDLFQNSISSESFQRFTKFLESDFTEGAGQKSFKVSPDNQIAPQTAYLFSWIIWDDNLTVPIIAGFGGTANDFGTGFYYHPLVASALYKYYSGEILHQGQDRGFAFIYPAIVIHSPRAATPGEVYCTYSEHYEVERALFAPLRELNPSLFDGGKLLSDSSLLTNESGEQNFSIIYLDYTQICHLTRPNQCGGNVACPTSTPTPTPSPTPIEINSVGFTGDYPVYKYTTQTLIQDPTWTRNDPANGGNVVAYKKGTETSLMKLSANFILPTPPAPGQPLDVKVRVQYNNNTIAATDNSISVTGGSFSVSNLQVTTALEATPQVKKGDYIFNWQVTVDDGQTWRDAGSSQHTIYWTFEKPVNIDNTATCANDNIKRNCIFINGGGEIDFPGLFDLALEKAISPLSSTTQDTASIAKTLAKQIDMEVRYNPNPVNVNTDGPHPLFIYSVGEAQCSGNANLLNGLLRSIGIDNEVIYTWGGNPVPNAETGGRANYYKYQKVTITGNTYTVRAGSVTFKVKRPAKNSGGENLEKDPHFTFHATVRLNGSYYDPSYGADIFNDSDYPFSDIRLVETVDFPTADFNKPKWKHDNNTVPFVVKALTTKTFCVPREDNGFCTNNPLANIARTEKICKHSDSIPVSNPTPDPFAFPERPISYFDSDQVTDVAVWRPSDNIWYAKRSSDGTLAAVGFGQAGDKLVPDDYDGDGITDVAIWRPSDGNWWVQKSSDNTVAAFAFGAATDKPTVGDFDGDGKADFGVYRPGNGVWYIQRSRDGFLAVSWGLAEDKPVVGDYDHDHKSDFTVYRPSNGTWYTLRSSDYGVTIQNFGISEDIPLAGDFDGDGRTDIAVYRPSTYIWYVLRSTDGFIGLQLGSSGSIPVVGDYDGDRISDFAVFSPSGGIWTYWSSNDEELKYDYWGLSGDIPVPSAYNR